jgi:hypothetical protein
MDAGFPGGAARRPIRSVSPLELGGLEGELQIQEEQSPWLLKRYLSTTKNHHLSPAEFSFERARQQRPRGWHLCRQVFHPPAKTHAFEIWK